METRRDDEARSGSKAVPGPIDVLDRQVTSVILGVNEFRIIVFGTWSWVPVIGTSKN